MKIGYLSIKIAIVLCSMCFGVLVYAQQEISSLEDIQSQIAIQDNPDEALVQWLYAIDDLRDAVQTNAPDSPYLEKITSFRDDLRKELEKKKALRPLSPSSLSIMDTYRDDVLTKDLPLDRPCPEYEQLVDDRAFALDLPASLITATWLMESGCRRSRPDNGDGIFQIVSKDYGTGTIGTGHWIWMMYDFSDFIEYKFDRYDRANKLDTGVPFDYQNLTYTGIVQFGALYNGLSGASIRGNIQPAAENYVYGNLNQDYVDTPKDGLLVRIMKAMRSSLDIGRIL